MHNIKSAIRPATIAVQDAATAQNRGRPLPAVMPSRTHDTGRIVLGGGFRLAADRSSK